MMPDKAGAHSKTHKAPPTHTMAAIHDPLPTSTLSEQQSSSSEADYETEESDIDNGGPVPLPQTQPALAGTSRQLRSSSSSSSFTSSVHYNHSNSYPVTGLPRRNTPRSAKKINIAPTRYSQRLLGFNKLPGGGLRQRNSMSVDASSGVGDTPMSPPPVPTGRERGTPKTVAAPRRPFSSEGESRTPTGASAMAASSPRSGAYSTGVTPKTRREGSTYTPKVSPSHAPSAGVTPRDWQGSAEKRTRKARKSVESPLNTVTREEEYVGRSSSHHEPSASPRPASVPVDTLISDFFQPCLLIIQYAWWLIKNVLGYFKKPLYFLFFFYLLAIASTFAGRFVTNIIFQSLRGLCYIPGVSTFHILPFCTSSTFSRESDFPAWPGIPAIPSPWSIFESPKYPSPDFPQLIHLQSHFSNILEKSEVGSILGLELKNAEISLRDLSTLVKISKLQCKVTLASHLDSFVQDSKAISMDLSRFESRVGGAIDVVLAMNEYSIAGLEAAKARSAEISASRISSGLMGVILAPFRAAESSAIQASIRNTFLDSSTVLERNLRQLIFEAEMVLRKLNSLDERLVTISQVVAKEDDRVDALAEEILGDLWTMLGGNRRRLSNLANHKELLGNIAIYRSRALAQVSSTLLELQTMYTDLAQLRDSVSVPLVEADSLPLDEEEEGELRIGRGKIFPPRGRTACQIPLEVQIEAVRKGAQRLAEGRNRGKERMDEDIRRVLDKALSGDRGGDRHPERLAMTAERDSGGVTGMPMAKNGRGEGNAYAAEDGSERKNSKRNGDEQKQESWTEWLAGKIGNSASEDGQKAKAVTAEWEFMQRKRRR